MFTTCVSSQSRHVDKTSILSYHERYLSRSDHGLCAFALSSSRFAARSFPCSCLIAAFTFLCRFRRPFPRLGPSITTGSAIRCFRFASCSARCFSRFLSRFRSVVKDALRRLP